MAFVLSFHPTVTPGACSSLSAGPEVCGDYESMVMVACKAISEAGGGNFRIGGFGAEVWPLDIVYDFSAFMEQFPSLLIGLRDGREVAVDIYSQGIERELIFRPHAAGVIIQCVSRTEWIPNPEFESIAQGELISSLLEVAVNFAKSLKIVDFELAGAEPFVHWLNGEI